MRILPLLLLVILPTLAQAQYVYTVENGTVTITKYTGPGGDVVIPDTIAGLPVTSIGDCAFCNCTGLTSIVIPDSVISIGMGAFSGCTGLNLRIPSGVMSISGWNLASVWGLVAIEVDPLNPVYSSLQGVLYDKSQTTVILCPPGKAGSVTVPGTVASLGPEAFKYCVSPQHVYFLGDAPAYAGDVFERTAAVTIFYVAGSSGWESNLAGRSTVSWNGLFGAQTLEMHAGLTIIGEIGQVYSIEYVTDLTNPAESDWMCLEYLQLPASPYLWTDKSTPATGKRFYRAVAMEPPENMVFIPPGTFRMGTPTNEVDRSYWEGPQTDVIISRGFWMGKHEVTQGEYLEVMGSNPSWFNGVRGEGAEWEIDYGTDLTRPVETVLWDDAVAYCAALTERERLTGRIAPNAVYRLPTEAEWEYACRAGTSTRFSYGDDPGYTNLTNYAWYEDNSGGTTHAVGQKLPNLWGLHDMHGNIPEWCLDWHVDLLPGGIALDPQGPAASFYRVVRGGPLAPVDEAPGRGLQVREPRLLPPGRPVLPHRVPGCPGPRSVSGATGGAVRSRLASAFANAGTGRAARDAQAVPEKVSPCRAIYATPLMTPPRPALLVPCERAESDRATLSSLR